MAIETAYRGATFRSRLEARWAAYFDLRGWPWVYEPWDGNGYIPDFILTDWQALVEVRPETTLVGLEQHVPQVEAGIAGHWHDDYLIVGATPCIPDRG
jgi:hypothetical protein